MKKQVVTLTSALIGCLWFAGISSAGPEQVKISKSGESSLQAVLEGKKIQVKFHTIVLRKADPGFPQILDDYDEVSIVQDIHIVVDGKSVIVPWSVYADLFDLRGATLRSEKGLFELVTGGAGGAETYSVRIYFNARRVVKRESYNAFSPNKPGIVILYSPPIEM